MKTYTIVSEEANWASVAAAAEAESDEQRLFGSKGIFRLNILSPINVVAFAGSGIARILGLSLHSSLKQQWCR